MLFYTFYELFLPTVPAPNVTISPAGPLSGAMVGSPLMIQCTVSTVSGVESSSLMISWMGPGVSGDSRVTISGTTGLMSTLNFMYLMEGDEGTYTCNVMILGTDGSASVALETLAGKVQYHGPCTVLYVYKIALRYGSIFVYLCRLLLHTLYQDFIVF